MLRLCMPNPGLTQPSQPWAAVVTLTLIVLCAFGLACAAEEHPDLLFSLCWVPPPFADGQIPSFLAVASTTLLTPVVSGSDGGHQVLREGRGGEGKGKGRGGRNGSYAVTDA